jgi:hypothetical protein
MELQAAHFAPSCASHSHAHTFTSQIDVSDVILKIGQ